MPPARGPPRGQRRRPHNPTVELDGPSVERTAAGGTGEDVLSSGATGFTSAGRSRTQAKPLAPGESKRSAIEPENFLAFQLASGFVRSSENLRSSESRRMRVICHRGLVSGSGSSLALADLNQGS